MSVLILGFLLLQIIFSLDYADVAIKKVNSPTDSMP